MHAMQTTFCLQEGRTALFIMLKRIEMATWAPKELISRTVIAISHVAYPFVHINKLPNVSS